MKLLYRPHAVAGFFEGANSIHCSLGATDGRHDRRSGVNSTGADLDFVTARHFAGGSIDDELQLVVLQQIQSTQMKYIVE